MHYPNSRAGEPTTRRSLRALHSDWIVSSVW